MQIIIQKRLQKQPCQKTTQYRVYFRCFLQKSENLGLGKQVLYSFHVLNVCTPTGQGEGGNGGVGGLISSEQNRVGRVV